MSTTRDYVILDLASEDEAGEWVEDAEDSLSAIVGVRSELAAGDLRPLYLAWLSAYGAWERDEDAFGDEDEDELEPPVPAGLGSLQVAAEASPGLPELKDDARALATHIAKLPVSDKDRLLTLVAEDQAARARMELLRGFRGDPDERRSRPRRTVAGLLDAAAARRMRREQAAEAAAAVQQALREQQRDQAQAFARRFAALREAHLRKPSLIARFDRAGLTV